MKIKQLEKEIGTLSNPSKMPAYAWGISALRCIVGSKLVKIKGEFVWHNHKDTDEAFIVIDGKMIIDFQNDTINLSKGLYMYNNWSR